jgi:hypothetical protein
MMCPTPRYFTRSAPLPTPSHRYVRVTHLHPGQRNPQAHALTRAVAIAVQPTGIRILSAPTRAASPAPVTLPSQFHTYARRSHIAVRVGSAP